MTQPNNWVVVPFIEEEKITAHDTYDQALTRYEKLVETHGVSTVVDNTVILDTDGDGKALDPYSDLLALIAERSTAAAGAWIWIDTESGTYGDASNIRIVWADETILEEWSAGAADSEIAEYGLSRGFHIT